MVKLVKELPTCYIKLKVESLIKMTLSRIIANITVYSRQDVFKTFVNVKLSEFNINIH